MYMFQREGAATHPCLTPEFAVITTSSPECSRDIFRIYVPAIQKAKIIVTYLQRSGMLHQCFSGDFIKSLIDIQADLQTTSKERFFFTCFLIMDCSVCGSGTLDRRCLVNKCSSNGVSPFPWIWCKRTMDLVVKI